MGLSLIVGIYGAPNDMDYDEESIAFYDEEFARINVALSDAGLPPHLEQRKVSPPLPVRYNMSYGALLIVRRFAARLWASQPLPEIGVQNTPDDPILLDYYERLHQNPSSNPAFMHLMEHSGTSGYYLPMHFEQVIYTDPEVVIDGGVIGSSHKLIEDCEALAEAMRIPLDLDLESSEYYKLVNPRKRLFTDWLNPIFSWREHQFTDWRRYAYGIYGLLALHRCAKALVESGCAIVFI